MRRQNHTAFFFFVITRPTVKEALLERICVVTHLLKLLLLMIFILLLSLKPPGEGADGAVATEAGVRSASEEGGPGPPTPSGPFSFSEVQR